jgi:23S rRNA (cytidine2498-2'-O)-methyltransferase
LSAQFLFVICQTGAERALKDEVASRHPWLRFAFSRPGFVTFRHEEPRARGELPAFESVFARTWGLSLGRVAAPTVSGLADELWRHLGRHLPRERVAEFRNLHVWQRDRALPGDESFDPALLAPARAAGDALLAAQTAAVAPTLPVLNETARPGELVLDCVLVEPLEWWLGWHRADAVETRWPGGAPPLVAPKRMISRAYLKILEALLWSELPVGEGDHCVEIGCAPGGSCLALLERGCIVTGIDPAEMDPLVLAQPNFQHLRAKAKEVKRSVFRACRWLIMDANVAPNYTLDTIEAIVTAPRVRPEGLVLTLKLTDPKLAANLPAFEQRIRTWGYKDIRMRQLTFNRQEVCAVVRDRSTH